MLEIGMLTFGVRLHFDIFTSKIPLLCLPLIYSEVLGIALDHQVEELCPHIKEILIVYLSSFPCPPAIQDSPPHLSDDRPSGEGTDQ